MPMLTPTASAKSNIPTAPAACAAPHCSCCLCRTAPHRSCCCCPTLLVVIVGWGHGRWSWLVVSRSQSSWPLVVVAVGYCGCRSWSSIVVVVGQCHDHLSFASCSTHVVPPLLRLFSSCPLSLTRPPRVDRMFLIADSYASL